MPAEDAQTLPSSIVTRWGGPMRSVSFLGGGKRSQAFQTKAIACAEARGRKA